MKKLFLLLTCSLFAFNLIAQQTVTLKFTALSQDGNYMPFDVVNVTNVTRGWTESLIYPDTTMVLTSYNSLNDNYYNDGFITEAYPNPFSGKTSISFSLDKSKLVNIRLYNINGYILSEYNDYLEVGTHQISISVMKPQMVFLVIKTDNNQFVKKIVNMGFGETNSIRINNISYESNNTREINSGEFNTGDVMSYSAVLINNGYSIYSNTITQAQYNNEIITLVFPITKPTVSTSNVSDITAVSAVSGGVVTHDGNGSVSARGVCWDTIPNPTINHSHTNNGAGIGSFTSYMDGLECNTIYYIRAYATNEVGTSYGGEINFTTEDNLVGALPGLFSVSDNQQVLFSKGNLQYQASTNTWRFADNQNDCIGASNSNISQTYNGWIDLFGWGTSGYNHGAICYQPWSTSTNNNYYFAYGYHYFNLYDQSGQADWGYNTIYNGGNQNNLWRTLTSSEYYYLFHDRMDAINKYSFGTVANVHGLIILPDDWILPYGCSFVPHISNWETNSYTLSQWSDMESAGAVFLPACGNRSGSYVNYVGSRGGYWSSSSFGNEEVHKIYFDGPYLGYNDHDDDRLIGYSVRLVRSFNTPNVTTPNVSTNQVSNITDNSAVCGGNVTSSGGASVTQRGVCWSTNHNPTLSNDHTTNGTGIGSFTANITGLNANTTYYVRAYATNSAGTSYGYEVSFTTSLYTPIGALNGLFSVSPTQQVCFSQGNLQYQASTNTWRFANNQYDYIGDNNSNISSYYNGWIDLFGWGTSGYNHGAVCYQPWSISQTNSDYYAYGSSNYNLYDQTGQADWGYNAINNGGNCINQWRVLTASELYYLFNTRTNAANKYSFGTVNNITGLILLPDEWTLPNGCSFIPQVNNWNTNVYSLSQWSSMEQNGAVFLPTSGNRSGTYYNGSHGGYWSSSSGTNNEVCKLYWTSASVHIWSNGSYYDDDRLIGYAVRLIHNVEYK